MRHSSISRPKNRKLSSVISFSQSRAARWFVLNFRSNPDDGDRLQPRRIGKQLTEMGVVGLLQLIFNQHYVASANFLANDVRLKPAHKLLRRF